MEKNVHTVVTALDVLAGEDLGFVLLFLLFLYHRQEGLENVLLELGTLYSFAHFCLQANGNYFLSCVTFSSCADATNALLFITVSWVLRTSLRYLPKQKASLVLM